MKIRKIVPAILAITLLWTSVVISKQGYLSKIAQGEIRVSDNKIPLLVSFKIDEENSDNPSRGILEIRRDGINGDWKKIEIKYVKVDGKFLWLAGKCVKDSGGQMVDRWLFVVIQDQGSPARIVDHIWWQWLDDLPNSEELARKQVEKLAKPADNKPISSGYIEITKK